MRYTEENKPDSPTEVVLAHVGVKGMKWGVRRANPSGGQIKLARTRQAQRFNKILEADDRRIVGETTKTQHVKERKTAEREFKAHEDRVTASRLTNGEKAALIFLGGPVGAVVIGASKANTNRTIKSVTKARKNG